MNLLTVEGWLSKISAIYPTEIELGLDRVRKVALNLGITSFPFPIIIVSGTNGKGSTVAGLESIYRAAGYQTGTYTSPFLFTYNEQIRINNHPVSDELLCEAFVEIEKARGDILLTQFEFSTLAAFLIFKNRPLDIAIMEVGLGGRLDAVNLVDGTIAIVTSIGIDHSEWLGKTEEEIGYEKAGIFRPHHPVICGDPSPPSILQKEAQRINTSFYCQGQDFHYQQTHDHWSWHDGKTYYDYLPLSTLAIANMSTVLMAITLLQEKLKVSIDAIKLGLSTVHLPGRIQMSAATAVKNKITTILDVSHNPEAIAYLASQLRKMPCSGKTYALFSMLKDKDILSSIKEIAAEITTWHVAPLNTARAASAIQLLSAFTEAKITPIFFCRTIKEAYDNILAVAQPEDRIIVFGSFHTVATVMPHTDANSPGVIPVDNNLGSDAAG